MILKPDYNVEKLSDIDFDNLSKQGIEVIIFDLDSTIMPSKAGYYPNETKALLKDLTAKFTVAVVSNNKNKDYISQVQSISHFQVIGHGNKPSPKVMREYLKSINKDAENTVVIGDRPLTDILAGKLLGAKTILVDSITKHSEPKLTRFVRFLERLTVSRKS